MDRGTHTSSYWKSWDTFREVPEIQDGFTPWKFIKLLSFLLVCLCGLLVFGLALCSKASILLLITLSGPPSHSVPRENKALVLLAIWGALVAPSLLLMLKNLWKALFFGSKIPSKRTVALVVCLEALVSGGSAILCLVAMPHLDIVTNITLLNSIAIFSSVFQVAARVRSGLRNRLALPPVLSVLLILLGYGLFLALYLRDPARRQGVGLRCGLAVGATALVSLAWWENYLSYLLRHGHTWLAADMQRCPVVLRLLTATTRLTVSGCVLAAYVSLSVGPWSSVRGPVGPGAGRVLAVLAGLQLLSSASGHWLALVACKMNALRRSFLLPLHLASLAALPLFLAPVFVSLRRQQEGEGPGYSFSRYCEEAVHAGNHSLGDGGFQRLVLDVTTNLCGLGLHEPVQMGLLTGSAVCWWGGFLLATSHLWSLRLQCIQPTHRLLVRRLYEGAFLGESLLLNTRFHLQPPMQHPQRPAEQLTLYMCATMWHETFDEMMKIIISMFRWDQFRPKADEDLHKLTSEAHIYFDDAFRTVPGSGERHANQYVEDLVLVIQRVYSIFQEDSQNSFLGPAPIGDQLLVRTPYGGRLQVTLPHGNLLVVHLKDKTLIRHKKRWSQIMYMYYLLGWRLDARYYHRWLDGEDEALVQREKEREKNNTYILALDGDTDFHPPAVMLLIDRLKQYPGVGAACGRIHPTGTGPIVWYQKFEYALTHWLFKTAEHVLGCVLCSPGCFSLFRGAALMDVNIMKKYTTPPTEALHHIQYDQGEDRWLCTLMLQQGWRVEYNAASDAYTNAPEGFKEFYNQRRRWTPSTLANSMDLLGGRTLARRNRSISQPYLLYQMVIVGSSILIPATVCLMITGMLTLLLGIDPNWALLLAVLPPAVYLLLCFHLEADAQVSIAAAMSVLYALVMMVTMLAVISFLVKDNTIFSPLSISFVTFVMVYVITALLHPQEAHLIVYGLLYILAIPSAYLLLSIYSIVNMNNVSWGTRETMPLAGSTATPPPPLNKMESARNTMRQLCQQAKCCRCSCLRECSGYSQVRQYDSELPTAATGNEPQNTSVEPGPQNTSVEPGPHNTSVEPGPHNTSVEPGPHNTSVEPGPHNTSVEPGPHNTSVGDIEHLQGLLKRKQKPPFQGATQSWIDRLQDLSDRISFSEEHLEKEEVQFWRELTERYLKPFPDDENQKRETMKNLKALRNKATFIYFFANLLWLVATFTLQLLKGSLSIFIPKYNNQLEFTGDFIAVEPVTFMFLVTFVVLVVLQFFTMLFHRTYTLIHFIGYVNTEMRTDHQQTSHQGDSSRGLEANVNEDELSNISEAGGTLV